jgi:hypothetical protein
MRIDGNASLQNKKRRSLATQEALVKPLEISHLLAVSFQKCLLHEESNPQNVRQAWCRGAKFLWIASIMNAFSHFQKAYTRSSAQ